jgi:hypothetical protein
MQFRRRPQPVSSRRIVRLLDLRAGAGYLVSVHAPATESRESRSSRRLYTLWTVALLLLAGGGLLCYAILGPYVRTSRLLASYRHSRDTSPYRPPGAIEILAVKRLGHREEAARQLGLYLRLPEMMTPRRREAVVLLGYCRSAGIEGLKSAMADDDPEVRRAAIRALGETKDPRATEVLVRTLGGADCSARVDAARALARLGDRRTVPALLAAMRDESSVVRTEAATALGALSDRRATPELIRALRDRYWTVRRAAVRSLKSTGGDAVLPEITRVAREDPDYHVREAAAEALRSPQSEPPGGPPVR